MKEDMGYTLKVNEIFTSIEGEGIRAGYPCTFIRLFGCPLRCTYCDSMYSVTGDEYKEMTIPDIVTSVLVNEVRRVTITGGEPLLQENVKYLIQVLHCYNIEVNVETNGSILIKDFIPSYGRDNLIFTVDWKSPSSGMSKLNTIGNFAALTKNDVLKFVVGSTEDLKDMQHVIQKYDPKCHIFVSPIFGKIEPRQIVNYLKDYGLYNVRIQLQLHKFIWDPDKRGV